MTIFRNNVLEEDKVTMLSNLKNEKKVKNK